MGGYEQGCSDLSKKSYLHLLKTAQFEILRSRNGNKSEVIILRTHKFKVLLLETKNNRF